MTSCDTWPFMFLLTCAWFFPCGSLQIASDLDEHLKFWLMVCQFTSLLSINNDRWQMRLVTINHKSYVNVDWFKYYLTRYHALLLKPPVYKLVYAIWIVKICLKASPFYMWMKRLWGCSLTETCFVTAVPAVTVFLCPWTKAINSPSHMLLFTSIPPYFTSTSQYFL